MKTTFRSSLAILIIALFVREIYLDGMMKQCVYEAAGNTYSISINRVLTCPLTIEV